ncbi:hypothetical protein [Lactiplantibacillus plajomi]|uniref:Cell surface protein n=1 Tax=Lactiplantibacillus plajomi TaxID=1457217 RepID=A0ABV6K7F0_9LACO|nr:hypothetical protein [Lactiplantibacillus plajomi]
MKLSRWLKRLIVVTAAVGLVLSTGVPALAADVTLPDASGDRLAVDEENRGDTSLSEYPTLNSVTADGVVNGRITTNTKTITATFSGTMTASSEITSFYFDLETDDGTSVVKSGTPTLYNRDNNDSMGKTTANISIYGKTIIGGFLYDTGKPISQTFSVDMSDINTKTPLHVAVVFTSTKDGTRLNRYSFATFKTNALYPTITNKQITPSTTTITGTGTPGNQIISNVTSGPVTVKADGTFELTLATGALKDVKTVTVTEYNDFGDKGTASAPVDNSLTIAVAKPDLTLTAAQRMQLASMTDGDFIKWLVDNAEVTAKDIDGSADGITYNATTSDLASQLKQVAAGGTFKVDLHAVKGTTQSENKTITLKVPGTLSFGTYSTKISFGTAANPLEVPTRETLFAPNTAWDVNVEDSRTTGSPWSVHATAAPMVAANDASRQLDGNLVYRDGDNVQDLTQGVLISSGTKQADVSTTNVTKDWSATKGIFLQVQPTMYATDYTGAVNWTLQDTP